MNWISVFCLACSVFQVRALKVEKLNNGAHGLHIRWDPLPDGHALNYTLTIKAPWDISCPNPPSPVLWTFHTANTQLLIPSMLPHSEIWLNVTANLLTGPSRALKEMIVTSPRGPSEAPPAIRYEEIGADGLSFDWDHISCFISGIIDNYRYSLRKVDGAKPEVNDQTVWIAKDVETLDNSVTFNNLANSSDYEFSVHGFTSGGEGPTRKIVVHKYGTNGPKLNKEPVITEVESNAIGIEWTSERDLEEYKVMYRPTGSLNRWTEYGDWQTETSSKVTNLTSDSKYEISVRVRRNGLKGPIGPLVSSSTKCEQLKGYTKQLSIKAEVISEEEAKLSWMFPDIPCKDLVFHSKVFVMDPEMGLLDEYKGHNWEHRLLDLKPNNTYKAQLKAITKSGQVYNYTPSIFNTFKQRPEIVRIVHVGSHFVRFQLGSKIRKDQGSFVNCNITVTLISKLACGCVINNVHHQFINASTDEATNIAELSPYSEYKFEFEIERADGRKWSDELRANTTSSEPTAIVSNIRLTECGSNHLSFRWDPVSCEGLNGHLLTYQYMLIDNEQAKHKQNNTKNNFEKFAETKDTMVTFDNLRSNSTYTLFVWASTVVQLPGPVTAVTQRTAAHHPPGVSLVQSTNNNLLFDIIPSVTSQGTATSYQVQIGPNEGPNGTPTTKQWNVKVRAGTKGGWGQWGSTLTFNITDQ